MNDLTTLAATMGTCTLFLFTFVVVNVQFNKHVHSTPFSLILKHKIQLVSGHVCIQY